MGDRGRRASGSVAPSASAPEPGERTLAGPTAIAPTSGAPAEPGKQTLTNGVPLEPGERPRLRRRR